MEKNIIKVWMSVYTFSGFVGHDITPCHLQQLHIKIASITTLSFR